MRLLRSVVVVLVGSASLAGVGCGQEPRGPLPGYKVDDALFAAETFELVEVDPAQPRIAINLVLLQLREGEGMEAAERIAADLGGSIAGQHPEIRGYQIDVGTTDVATLDAKVSQAQADPAVAMAGYDLEVVALAKNLEHCPPRNDNNVFEGQDRCPFEDERYYGALTIYESLRAELNPGDPMLGIVDTGVLFNHGELRTATLINAQADHGVMDATVQPRVDMGKTGPYQNMHGTHVAGIMVAANNMVGLNGLYSPFVDSRKLAVARNTRTAFGGMVAMQHTVNAGADVVNLSWGSEEILPTHPVWQVASDMTRMTMAVASNVLWVAAAPYEPGFELDGRNNFPGGIDLANVITVGGTVRCAPETAQPDLSWGNVDIAAQGNYFPHIDPNTEEGVLINSGGRTSFAAPQVTSLAGVLLSIEPTLAPAELKKYVIDHALPGPPNYGGRFLDFGGAVLHMINDHAGLTGESAELIDSGSNGEPDPLGVVVGRICGGITYQIEQLPQKELSGTDVAREDGVENGADVAGFIQPMGFGWGLAAVDGTSSLTITNAGSGFSLGEHPVGDMGISVGYLQDPETAPETGNAVSGTMTIDACEIVERVELEGLGEPPLVVFVSGSIDADLEYLPAGALTPEGRKLTGAFELPFINNPIPGDPQGQLLEMTCKNGKP